MSEEVNYHQKFKRALDLIKRSEEKPKLVLHVCCAPCACYPIQLLVKHFHVVLYFYNPNIYPYQEYLKRYNALEKYVRDFFAKYPDAGYKLTIIEKMNEKAYLEESRLWMQKVQEYAEEKEGGLRCDLCFRYRLSRAMNYAQTNKIAYVVTSLTSSRMKNSNLINQIGLELQELYSEVTYIPSDFKKENGEKISFDICREYGIYRQNYCGCYFSLLPRLQN